MARNEEKHFCRLNRMILQQQKEENEKKNPKRPLLNTLNSPQELKRWLPTVKRDIDFYLKQSQVWCYPERKIAEFNQRIDKLRGEYHAYVRKLRELEPNLGALPGTERGYSCKRPADHDDLKGSPGAPHDKTTSEDTMKKKRLKRISLPILKSNLEKQYAEEKVITMLTSKAANDEKNLETPCDEACFNSLNSGSNVTEVPLSIGLNSSGLFVSVDDQCVSKIRCTSLSSSPSTSDIAPHLIYKDNIKCKDSSQASPRKLSQNPLGLDYGDSDSEEEVT